MSVEGKTEFCMVFPGKVPSCLERLVVLEVRVATELVLVSRKVLRAKSSLLWWLESTHL